LVDARAERASLSLFGASATFMIAPFLTISRTE
jgi:hypothetical protein